MSAFGLGTNRFAAPAPAALASPRGLIRPQAASGLRPVPAARPSPVSSLLPSNPSGVRTASRRQRLRRWRPHGDSNPGSHRERVVSWTGLDDGDQQRSGQPTTRRCPGKANLGAIRRRRARDGSGALPPPRCAWSRKDRDTVSRFLSRSAVVTKRRENRRGSFCGQIAFASRNSSITAVAVKSGREISSHRSSRRAHGDLTKKRRTWLRLLGGLP